MEKIQNVRKGTTIKLEDELFVVSDFSHVKLGRGGAFVRLRIKNLRTGAVLERNLSPDDEVEIVRIEEKPSQYIYRESNFYYFMDQETYEQIALDSKLLNNVLKYLKENEVVRILLVNGEPIGVKLPNFCKLRVVSTEPPIKGARVASGLKPAKLETGVTVNVPLFINTGDIVKVDTRTDEYIERVG
ncbi:MAG: elongation factor P [bacterium]|nr:elongation factor P [bacterium]